MNPPNGSAVAVRVRVPATSANLGPGFDALGLALDLYDEATVTPRWDDEVVIHIAGLGAESLPRDERHLLLRSLRTAAEGFGLELHGVGISTKNAIPQGRGLGSSAATTVAAVAAAWMLVPGHEELDRAAVLAVAAGIEGHPDNVAACVYGGLTISWHGARGAAAAAMAVHPDVAAVLFVPAHQLSTETARGLLPPTVPHADAAFGAGRAALLIHALTVNPGLLLPATEDRLHQPYRAAAMTESNTLLEALRSAGIAAVISGAGPSVLALSTTVGATADLASTMAPPGWTGHRLAIAPGVDVSAVGGPGE